RRTQTDWSCIRQTLEDESGFSQQCAVVGKSWKTGCVSLTTNWQGPALLSNPTGNARHSIHSLACSIPR
ncbi:hypothetical protein, partial [Litorivivens sp.]|uniref:hypothetical protein n=1 Tax=Litorivivens sp. TaxID=2020868 RepID=UPI003568AB97